MSDNDFGDRLAATYHAAIRAQQDRSATVSIHVGQQVWDALIGLARQAGLDAPAVPAMCWGFPVVMEEGFLPDTIKVRATEVIP